MESIKKWASSRANLTAALTLLINIVQAFEPFMSAEMFVLVNAVLTAFIIFFRSNPKVV